MRLPSLFFILALVAWILAGCSDSMVNQAETAAPSPAVAPDGHVAVPFAADPAGSLAHTLSKTTTTTCTFTTSGTVMSLDADCTTDGTIFVPDGMHFEGQGYTITALDPPGDHFRGAVVQNAGATAYVNNVKVTVSGLANVCDNGDDRLRGIMFDGASGAITRNVVTGINQGASGCQEGNAIEVRNAPFDGTHPNTQTVDVSFNKVADYQKTGIVVNGDVDVTASHNRLSASATQANLAANGIQFGYGALGTVTLNDIDGNQWLGTSDYAATAILVYLADGLQLVKNKITGNSDIALYYYADNGLIDRNNLSDVGVDDVNSGYDYGLGDWGTGNVVTNNLVSGFDIPFDPASLDGQDGNKSLPPAN